MIEKMNKSRVSHKSRFFLLLFLLLIFCVPVFAFAQAKLSVSSGIPGNFPTANATSSVPGAFIANFYQLALMLGGILALGAIVYGGVMYAISAGNPSKQSEGREWIESALIGLLLLAGAYLVLFTINPNLVNLNLPGLSGVGTIQLGGGGGLGTTPSLPSGGGGTKTPATGAPGNCAGGQCQTLPNCTPVAGKTNCGGAPAMPNLLNCIDQKDQNYSVNEGYPPVGKHSSPGHNNGCSIDVHVSTCAQGAQFMQTAQQCGASQVLNEYASCGGTSYSHTSGGNIHVNAPLSPKGSGGC